MALFRCGWSFALLKPEWLERSLSRPDFVERRSHIEAAILHDFPDGQRVANVEQWILVEDLQVGELTGFESTEFAASPNGFA